MGSHTAEEVGGRVKNIPLKCTTEDSTETFTCRIWVRYAVRALHDAGYINCPDVLALEKEVTEVGEGNDVDTIQGRGFKLYTVTNSTST